MRRVWCLYRVSTKRQVNTDDDIPMQKNACHAFVASKPEWHITNELIEKGISGWSKKADERDALNTIKQGAIENQFDVLLVFMFDRLGRREDETPLIVNFLNQNHVEVWSTQEGQRNTETHIDKLLNYISFWQSDGESQKTSIRVREAKKQLSEQGYFQGGVPPIGYNIIETDQVHWKNKDRFVKELIADEEEAEMVQLIFNLYVERHMGYRKIVDYMNNKGYRNRGGKLFGISTIQRILSNPIYIGKKRYNSFNNDAEQTQPYNQKLQIVSSDVFRRAEQIRNTRRNKVQEQDKTGIPLTGRLIFSGLAYCEYCGAKLSGNYLYRNQKYKGNNYTNVIYRYRCPLNKGKQNCDHKQNVWGAKKYDGLVMEKLINILSRLNLKSYVDKSLTHKESLMAHMERNLECLEKEHQLLSNQLNKLNLEIGKSLVGESTFTPEQLSAAIKSEEEKLAESAARLKCLKAEIEGERKRHSATNYMTNELENWELSFNNADDDLRKTMLSRLVDKVYFGQGRVEVTFNLAFQECIQKSIKGHPK